MNTKPISDFIVGILIGVVAQLPGASGATIAVVFNVYERLIEDLAKIRDKLLKDLWFIIPIGIGGVLGYLLCAKVLDFFVEDYYIPMLFLFGMLIFVQIPDIEKNVDPTTKTTKNNIIAFTIGFAIMIALVIIRLTITSEVVDLNFAIMFGAGLIVIASMLSPGISGSTILLILGIYPAFIAALGNFNLPFLIPFGLGMVIGLLVFSKIVNHCMKNYRRTTYFAILGLTIGSVVSVLIEAGFKLFNTPSLDIFYQCLVCAIIGLVIGIGLCKLARRYSSA